MSKFQKLRNNMESLGLDWKLLLAQIVNFAILFVILKKVLYKPLIKAIDDRNKKINDALKNSQEIENKLKKIADTEANLISKAKENAKKEKDELMAAASLEREKMIEDAKESAKREVEKGLESLESAKKDAVNKISDEYVDKIAEKLLKRFSESTKQNKYPILKSLLK
jgi:F-type H+-transporting ATPase subunit b